MAFKGFLFWHLQANYSPLYHKIRNIETLKIEKDSFKLSFMQVFTVTQLTLAIKKELEPRFHYVRVEGEVLNLRAQSSGHFYFSLKDKNAQIAAVLFKGNSQSLSRLPKGGDRVIVSGELNLYSPRGTYQIVIRELLYAGVGDLLLKLHELKEKLKNRGWLSVEHKKPLPKYPKTIGVVTSPTGSVIQDILHVLKRRFPRFHLILNPVRVQGKEAASEIAQAIAFFNEKSLVDVMIVGRGGGSLQDLWPFNEECVAEAIFRSKIPIISAVGHETDVTLADCVADVRAPTPSAAAEICMKELFMQLDFLKRAQTQIDGLLKQKLLHLKSLVQSIGCHPILASPYAVLSEPYQRLDDFASRLEVAIRSEVIRYRCQLTAFKKELQGILLSIHPYHLRKKLSTLKSAIDLSHRHVLDEKKRSFHHLIHLLKALHPQTILKKGYCIPFKENGTSVILSSGHVEAGMGVHLRFHDGQIKTRVLEANRSNEL